MADTTTIMRTCDICNKRLIRWEITSIKKIRYFPGKLYNRCSSDIRSNTTRLASLCPTCMEKLENSIERNKYVNKKKKG